MTGAAVFDLDNTLVSGSSLFHFGMSMVLRRLVSPWQVLRFASAELAFVGRHGERDGLPKTVAERTLGMVRGLSQAALMERAREFAEHNLDRHLVGDVHGQMLDFRKAGYATFIATASPQELADAIAERLGMTGAVGTRSEVRDGHYTGRLLGRICHGPVKARRVTELFGRHDIDAGASWAFSDSVNDLPLLALVGHPVATNADSALRAIARTNEWRVLQSRDLDQVSRARLQSLFPFPF